MANTGAGLLRLKRVRYPDARAGNLVWMGRRKELGILQRGGRVTTPAGIFKCSAKDLWIHILASKWELNDARLIEQKML